MTAHHMPAPDHRHAAEALLGATGDAPGRATWRVPVRGLGPAYNGKSNEVAKTYFPVIQAPTPGDAFEKAAQIFPEARIAGPIVRLRDAA